MNLLLRWRFVEIHNDPSLRKAATINQNSGCQHLVMTSSCLTPTLLQIFFQYLTVDPGFVFYSLKVEYLGRL